MKYKNSTLKFKYLTSFSLLLDTAMAAAKTPKLEIKKTDIKLQNGYTYQIHFPEIDGRYGNATVYFKPIESFKKTGYFKTNDIYNTCLKVGLKPEDSLAHLMIFYPNGKYCNEKSGKDMRTGVGAAVLDKIINDSLENDAKLMYVRSTTDSMDSFLKKKGFSECLVFERQFYRLLD